MTRILRGVARVEFPRLRSRGWCVRGGEGLALPVSNPTLEFLFLYVAAAFIVVSGGLSWLQGSRGAFATVS
jgi:hypothetical protein